VKLLLALVLAVALWAQEPMPTFTGTIRGIGPRLLTIQTEDANVLEFYCSRKTKYYDGKRQVKYSALKPGDHVAVEARHAPDESLEAVTVRKQ
jgi:hypothetical protein